MRALNYPALVLNADFSPVSLHPVSIWGVARTLNNVMKGSVIVVEEYDAVLRSPNFHFRPPSVVALVKYVRRPETVPFTRLNIFLRDDFRCQYCGGKFEVSDLTFDHVIPRCHGGETNARNIVSACVDCNSRKGSRTDMAPLRPPRDLETRDLARANLARQTFHKSWLDYLYWSGALEKD